jgi:hypothetical protein
MGFRAAAQNALRATGLHTILQVCTHLTWIIRLLKELVTEIVISLGNNAGNRSCRCSGFVQSLRTVRPNCDDASCLRSGRKDIRG